MRDLAWFVTGGFVGMLGMAALFVRFLADRRASEWARIADALKAERASRCDRGQHREVLETTPPYLRLRCADCAWVEELGVAYLTGSNRKTRRAS